MVFSFFSSAFAANSTWINTGGVSSNWDETSNWYLAFIPGTTSGTTNTDVVTFNAAVQNFGLVTTPIVIDSGRNIGGISFDTLAGNYYIGSSTLDPLLLTSGGTIQILGTLSSTNTIETINAPLVIEGASGTYTFSNNSANGAIAGAGTLNIGGGITGGAAGSTVLTLSGTNTNSNTISGIIANGTATSLAVTKSGAGTWVLSGANTYTGATTVSAGTLQAGIVNQAFGVGSAVTVAGAGTLDLAGYNEAIGSLAGAGKVTSGTAGSPILTVGGIGSSTGFSGIIQNGSATSVGLTKVGGGTLTLSGANTYTGATTITTGTLQAGVVTQAFGVGSAVSVGTGATLDLGGFNETIGSLAVAGVVTNSGVSSAAVLTAGGNNTSTTFSGNIQDGTSSLGLDKEGSGTLFLSGDNTYSAGTTLGAGILGLASSTAIGTSGTITFSGGSLQYSSSNNTDYSGRFSTAAGQAFNIDTNGQTVIFLNPLGASTADTLTKIGSGTLILTSANLYSGITTISGGTLQIGNNGIAGTLGTGNVTDNANLAFALTSASTTVSNYISGTGSVTQNGTGTLTLSGPNTYSGATTVNSGILKAGVITQAFGVGSAVSVGTGATLDMGGFNETIGSLAGDGLLTNSGGSASVLSAGGNNTSTTFSGNIQNGAHTVALTKDGSGTLVLSGNNTYSGGTTLDAGILDLGSSTAIGTSGSITFNGGTLQYSSANNTDYSGRFSAAADQAFNIDTNGRNVIFATALSGDTLTKLGQGILTLTGANSYTGGTTINGGTLTVSGSGTLGATTGALALNNTNTGAGNDVVLNLSTTAPTVTGSLSGTIAAPSSGTNTATINNGGQLFTVNQTANGSYAGVIAGNGGFTLGNLSTSTLMLSGDNTYSGGTTINAGTLQVGNANALGTGAVINKATLDLGTNNLLLGTGSSYTQNNGSTLALTADTASIYGRITSAVAASVASTSTINVTVGGYIQNGSVLEIINTAGTGIDNVPATITSTSSLVSFSGSILNRDLVLTASNSGFASLANNANAQAVATALDNITSPSSDMATILNTLAVQSNAKISAALNTMGPVVDAGVVQNSSAALNNLVSATLDRVQNSLDHAAAGNAAGTGVSSGDDSSKNGIWAKPYGSYLTQGTFQGIQGYDAWNAGTAVGYDRMITDAFTIGVSGGYTYGQVNSDINNANTDINSAQGTLYAGYQDPNYNYFIDAAASMAFNWYDGRRDISVGNISRTADANYDGQQYGTYVEGGYKFDLGNNLQLKPEASLQWTHLELSGYTETNADALDLNVERQGYDQLESGLGYSLSQPERFNWGACTSEFHAKWLHDFVSDQVSVTSTFTGGGGSFSSKGAKLPRDGADLGGKLSLDFNNDISFIAALDAEIKDRFFGIYGSGTVRYKF